MLLRRQGELKLMLDPLLYAAKPAIGRSRQAVDAYIAELRATTLLELDLKIFRLNPLGIPQDRIAKRLGINRRTLSDHLAKMSELANPPNNDLSKGFTVPQVAQNHDWPVIYGVVVPGVKRKR
jgi:biotin operon repressor